MELAEDRRHLTVSRGVADVVLAVLVRRRRDHELLRLRVVRRRCLNSLHIRAVARLAHRERARKVEGGNALEVELVVLAGAQVVDGAAEEPELDTALDEEREVGEARASRSLRSRSPPSRVRRTPPGREATAHRSRRGPTSTRRPSRGTPPSGEARSAFRTGDAPEPPSRARGPRAARRRGGPGGPRNPGSALSEGSLTRDVYTTSAHRRAVPRNAWR